MPTVVKPEQQERSGAAISALLEDIEARPRWAEIVNVHTNERATVMGIVDDEVWLDLQMDEFVWWVCGSRWYKKAFIVRNFVPARALVAEH